jgi:hypothetical protein
MFSKLRRVKKDQMTNFSMDSVLKFGILSLLFFSIVSCNKDEEVDDLQRPEIRVVSTNPELSSGIVCETESNIILLINTGESVEVTVEVTDDVALGSLKFDLHHNFDCHGHRSGAKSTVWSYIEIVELSGVSEVISRTIQSPDDVRPGNYHLGLMALDEMGREAEMRYFDLVVRDPSDTLAPEIELDSPEENAVHTSGNPLEISGSISDDSSMDTGGYELTLITDQGQELSVARVNYPEGTGNAVNFSESYSIPGFVGAGTLTLRMEVNDWKNNQTILERSFEFVD